jgi:PAS domain S-box-containing protein
MPQWNWIAPGALALVMVYQQFRVYRIRRESKHREELFQIVTENAADMIALVDVKGRRLYNSPAYKRILGYSAAELGETSSFDQIHPDDRFKVLEAARGAQHGNRENIGLPHPSQRRHMEGSRVDRQHHPGRAGRGRQAGHRESRRHRAQTGGRTA